LRRLRLVALALACSSCEDLPNVAPTASFIFTPVSPIFAGQTRVTFNASASQDTDGSIASYTWNFGDGTPEESQAGAVTSHVFPDTAATCTEITYTVLLIVTDDKGQRASASQGVRVVEAPAPTSAACLGR
jgi:PKD repeat protein